MADVFFSYVEEDRSITVQLAEYLERAGFSTWYYQRDSVPGRSYLLQTAEAIEQSQVVVLLISSHSMISHQVTREVVRAHESAKHFVPVLVDVTHTEFQERQPEWREAIGSATSVAIQDRGVEFAAQRIELGLANLNVGTSREVPAKKNLNRLPAPSHVFRNMAITVGVVVIVLVLAFAVYMTRARFEIAAPAPPPAAIPNVHQATGSNSANVANVSGNVEITVGETKPGKSK